MLGVHDISFSQIWNETKDYVDLNRLAEELEILRLKLKEEAKHLIMISRLATLLVLKVMREMEMGLKRMNISKCGENGL